MEGKEESQAGTGLGTVHMRSCFGLMDSSAGSVLVKDISTSFGATVVEVCWNDVLLTSLWHCVGMHTTQSLGAVWIFTSDHNCLLCYGWLCSLGGERKL
jgi:hypothetical protein